jgi:hypothetical protein
MSCRRAAILAVLMAMPVESPASGLDGANDPDDGHSPPQGS